MTPSRTLFRFEIDRPLTSISVESSHTERRSADARVSSPMRRHMGVIKQLPIPFGVNAASNYVIDWA